MAFVIAAPVFEMRRYFPRIIAPAFRAERVFDVGKEGRGQGTHVIRHDANLCHAAESLKRCATKPVIYRLAEARLRNGRYGDCVMMGVQFSQHGIEIGGGFGQVGAS